MVNDYTNISLEQTQKLLNNKEFSKKELNSSYLKRIEAVNPQLNAYLAINHQSDGVPVAIKDVFSTKGITSTAGSKILAGYISVFDATVVERLTKNGVSILGKTNCDEFAMGSSGENSAYGATKNPWDITKVAGGSSSGSAVAVAADLCVFAIGTDTGGSIRLPASLCGVVGLKPSYGRVSRYGVIPMTSSLDCPGPITKSVADARKVLEWINGEDGYDSNVIASRSEAINIDRSLRHFVPRDDGLLTGLRVGVPKEYFSAGLDPGVEKVIKEAINKLEELGAEIMEIELPHTKYAVAVYYIIMASEVSSNLARFDGIRYGGDRSKFGEEVIRRIVLGTFSLSSGYYDDYYQRAAKVRTLIKQDFDAAFKQCDVIVGPVSPTIAWNLGEKIADPLTMYLSDIYTVPASLAGIPGLSVPCGFSDGLPVGLQILGKYLDEEVILNVGEIYEQATNWHTKKPVLSIED